MSEKRDVHPPCIQGSVKRERKNQAGDRMHGTLLHAEKQYNCFLFLTE
jgi:hypothetical protein